MARGRKEQPPRSGQLPFSVDSALLEELGERLVGKAHIALAELIKNSYDADATKVEIRFGDDTLEISDDGCGMDLAAFTSFWMRIGSPHKQRQEVSGKFHRPLTGSKGVGRLAVQFLATNIKITTRAEKAQAPELVAKVDWNRAVKAGELTHAVAEYEEGKPSRVFPGNSKHGTIILLSNLRQIWAANQLKDLAQEIWWLRPPFATPPAGDDGDKFDIEVITPDPAVAENFNEQMTAYLNIWYAKIMGRLEILSSKPGKGRVRIAVEFSDGEKQIESFVVEPCPVRELDFEIRAYHLRRRQKHGIRVEDARQYFNKFGGIHVYDAGFHLPYYGPDTDWLGIEIDHSHRLSRSQLLPEELQVQGGMEYLPTQSRLLGVVHVNTSKERALAGKSEEHQGHLAIQISRDRLVDNEAFQTLRRIVRWSLDYYAQNAAKRAVAEAESIRERAAPIDRIAGIEDILERYQTDIPTAVYKSLVHEISETVESMESEARAVQSQIGALGALATAGMSALAYQHEVNKQFGLLDEIVRQLRSIQTVGSRSKKLHELAEEIAGWLDRARATYGLFSYLLDSKNAVERRRLRVGSVVQDVLRQTSQFLKKVTVDTEALEESIRLPLASFAEWSAIFQNIVVNAANAMVESKTRILRIRSAAHRNRHVLIFEDTGTGIDVESSQELFEPFKRRTGLSQERRALGLGGSGLGLTIVRMIASNLGCRVRFVAPSRGFRTAFELSWGM